MTTITSNFQSTTPAKAEKQLLIGQEYKKYE